MKVQTLLEKLERVRRVGKHRWTALCPAHDDGKPSLNIAVKGGKVLIHCFAGCAPAAVLRAVGLTWADLSEEPRKTARNERQIVATYDYVDGSGRLLFQVVRYKPKAFAQRRPDGQGGWIWNLEGVPRVLYRLGEVLEAAGRGKRVYIVEGEKDADALAALGVCATTNSGGAGKWRKKYSDDLAGAHVVILPDNDEPGRKHAQAVAASLQGKAASVKVLALPRLPEGGDASDWIAAGGTREQLEALADRAPEWSPAPAAPTGFPLTDLGNAERLVATHGERLRFNVNSGRWHWWTGKVWAPDETGEVHRRLREVVRSIVQEAEAAEDPRLREELLRHALRSESAGRLTAAVELARHCPGIPVTSAQLDRDPWLLTVLNGTLDLRTGQLREHRAEDLSTRLAPVTFDPEAKCPRWRQFLREVLPDAETVGFVQRFAGLCLTGDTSEHACFFFVGRGLNGKGVLVDTLLALLGDYGAETPVTTFLERRETVTADLASLVGVRLVKASEAAAGQRVNEPLLKAVTGEDQLTVRHLYREYFTFRPAFKVVLLTNEVPYLSQSRAVRDRVHVVRFPHTFYAPEEGREPVRDPRLRETLRQELSGIFNWALEGLRAWRERGLAPPAPVRAETAALFEALDPLGDFLDAEVVFAPRALVHTREIWQAYVAWTERERRPRAFHDSRLLTRNLAQRDGVELVHRKDGNYLVGLGLVSKSQEELLSADVR